MPQIKDIAITKTAAEAGDLLIMQNPTTGETYNITKANLLAGFSGGNVSVDTDFESFGLRKINAAYAGALIRVVRSDNAEMDIGFGNNNNLDSAALLSFAGSGDAFVKTLYGQRTGWNATQSSAALRPKIISNGVLETLNSKPAMNFLGGKCLEAPFANTFSTPFSVIVVAAAISATHGALVKVGSSSDGIGIGVGGGTFDSNGLTIVALREAIAWMPSSNNLSAGVAAIIELASSSNQNDLYLNGIMQSLSASSGSFYAPTGALHIGGYDSRMPDCKISEVRVTNTILSSSERTSKTDEIKSYYSI